MKRRGFIASSAGAAALASAPVIARASADVTLTTATGRLGGTLELPATAAGAPPVVLLIAGSGPTDRDGNSPLLPGKNDALKGLALGLAQRGIASLRYDKRGVGASAGAAIPEVRLRVSDFVDDAAAWLAQLRAQRRFSRIAVAGHSEGALIGMLAGRSGRADAFASLEGAGRPAAEVLREQFARSPEPVRRELDAILDRLAAGETVPDVPPAYAAIFRPSVQPYLLSWFRYDPARELAALALPRLIVQGGADVQTPPADGAALHRAAPAARYLLVGGMNHVLKHAPDTSSQAAILAGYTDPALPVEAAVVDAVAALALDAP